MSARQTYVDEGRYIFTTEFTRDEFPVYAAVHWTGTAFDADGSFLSPLRSYLGTHHEPSEVWFVYPQDLHPLFETLRASPRFAATSGAGPVSYRFFSVDIHGAFTEEWATLPAVDVFIDDVVQDGLRQLFRDTESLALSAAGFHFAHPSGKHSEYFIRASQAVSRRHHSYFLAMALLRRLPLRPVADGPGTIWIDTAAISSLGYAYADLLRRGGATASMQVESFGGHDGVTRTLKPRPADVILVSGSTSGSLARKIIAAKSVSTDQIATLFYLANRPWNDAHGRLLCDLTSPTPIRSFSVRESRLEPYDAFDASDCRLCDNGRGVVVLEGDSFFPAATQMELRMPGFRDRPLDGVTGKAREGELVHFDGQEFFTVLAGAEAMVADTSAHGVSTEIAHLLTPGSGHPAATRILEEAITCVSDPVAVISLTDPQSRTLGEFLASSYFGKQDVGVRIAPAWREWRKPGIESLADAAGGTVLIVAAVIASGRALTDLSRELRQFADAFHPEYLVAAAHPESSTTWNILRGSIERVSSGKTTHLNVVWKVPRQPRSPGTPSPWSREEATLGAVHKWLTRHEMYKHADAQLEPRLSALNAPTSDSLFVGALIGKPIAPLNRNFALWPTDWAELPGSPRPTHAEIYATVSHFMYESRHRNAKLEKRSLTVRRHGYVLHPSLFDRFNDGVIQAAVLRAAEPGELDYRTDLQASAAIANLLLFILTNVRTDAGGAAYEFLLALSEGLSDDQPQGLRIHEDCLNDLLSEVIKLYGKDFEKLQDDAPQVRALLLFVRARGVE